MHRCTMRRSERLLSRRHCLRIDDDERGPFIGKLDVPAYNPTYLPCAYALHAICGFPATACLLRKMSCVDYCEISLRCRLSKATVLEIRFALPGLGNLTFFFDVASIWI